MVGTLGKSRLALADARKTIEFSRRTTTPFLLLPLQLLLHFLQLHNQEICCYCSFFFASQISFCEIPEFKSTAVTKLNISFQKRAYISKQPLKVNH